MDIRIQPFTVHKRVPLTISRGTTAGSTNLWLRLSADGIEGWGEASPFSVGPDSQTTELISAQLQQLEQPLRSLHPLQAQAIDNLLDQVQAFSAVRAAIDLACHDWLGKRVGLPLWQLWGLERQRIGPTAVTVGIGSAAAACDRLQKWQQQVPVRSVKIKLGSPAGIAADQTMFSALLSQLPEGVKVSIDANGGWSLADAITMAEWLADRGVTYLEQPLAAADDGLLPQLYARSPLPLFVDESCFTSADIPPLAGCVHGINIKLMKSGGLSEARRMIHTARACGLQVMFGCYSDSAIANTALAHLSPLADHLDLDSHLNLSDDPFIGAELRDGRLIPPDAPGLGCHHADA
ncbi:dipeptide epimerase [Romeria aff. gracilis LEGE 07310]|uniref:Dipeptide epimerase n=1 Tax=Vasconcelosia minhoensis LEGE 07310 TaxID=915328 RepID=A0A8J7AMG4_9CYAN|nr:dipeptide epimerase [Romeria gracilis]MBE9077655.1 dipeptide epimerase [Romeria aff. gracilis LEGE 07310]